MKKTIIEIIKIFIGISSISIIIALAFFVDEMRTKGQDKTFVYRCPSGCVKTTFSYYCSSGFLTQYLKFTVDEFGNYTKNDYPKMDLDYYQCNSCLSLFDEKRLQEEARLYNRGFKK